MLETHDPVELYRSVLKEAHARHTSEMFEELVAQSAVDSEANAATTAEVYRLEKEIGEAGGSNSLWKGLRIASILGAGLSFVLAYANRDVPANCAAWIIAGLGLGALVIFFVNAKISALNDRIRNLKAQCEEQKNIAWSQMAPLNALYSWETFAKLLKKTFPLIELDPYFSEARLASLQDGFGLDGSFNRGRSVIFTHSGMMDSNPFVLAQTLDHWMGTRTYHGSLTISWTTIERDGQGRPRTVRHTQTLRASVDKPFPEYIERSTLIYGNKAAPDLSFNREPTSLADAGDGIIGKWRKGRALKKLKKFSQNLKDDSQFTLMANHEFETLFNAPDRDHEVQFRVLFTPMAQKMMVKLLQDKEVGYGDAFDFHKERMINKIVPEYLIETDISAEPALFFAFDMEKARAEFNRYHNELFRSFFFTFAPLLVISVYQEQKGEGRSGASAKQLATCFWEHEAIANHMGEDKFAHPHSITRNLVKTDASTEKDGAQMVEVTAYGYRGEDRVDTVRVRGGDGNYHIVQVPWVEYIPVEQTSRMIVCDGAASKKSSGWQSIFDKRGIPHEAAVERRSIVAARL